MLTEFASDLSLVLLFLRNIAKIGIYEWKENAPAPIRLYETKVGNMTHELELKRALKATNISSIHSASSFFSVLGEPCDYLLEIMSENLKGGSNLSTTVKYMVCNQLGGGDATKIANDPAHQSLRLVPWGGVAVMVESSNGKGLETGLAFCFLPLPTHNFLPIHVNGYFELSSNRRDIWYGDGLSGDGLLRAKWNASLLKDVISPCYSRAIINLARDKQINPNNHAQLFPQNIPPAPWDILAVSFFQLIQTQVCLYSAAHGGKWISPEECILLKRGIPQYEDLSRYLLKDGLPVVDNLSEDLEKALVKTKAVPQGYFLPSKLREIYKSVESIHAGDKEAIRVIVDFATSDLNTKNPEDIRHLIAVRLLPLANGSLTRFEQLSNINLESLDYLCSMGFTRSHATCALNTVGSDVEAALNWLFQNPNPSMKRSTDIYFLPSNKELILLARARNRLIDVDALSSSSLQLLRSSTLQAALNVKTLDFDSFQDLLSYVFPPQWYGQQSVQWDHNTSSSIENGIEWYRLLWEHIGPSEYLRIFQDKWPIVPTSVGVACTLSTMNGVVSVELIAPECLLCLQKLGVRVLLPGLFSTFHPHSDVWSYIQQPTPAGVLSGIGAVLTKGSTPLNIRRIFKSVSVTERISLRDFLLSGVFSEFTNEQQRVLKSLPIFYGVKPIAERDETDITWSSETLQDNNSISVGIVPVFVSIDTLSHPVYMCRDVSWELLDKHFIYIGDAKRTEGSVLFDLLVSLGVRKLSKVEFFCRHLIPRLSTENMTLSLRIRFVREMLNDVSHVLSEDADGSVIYTLESLPIFPSMTGEIRSITDLYDPEVEELEDIMDGSFLPAIELQEPTCLAALRSLGLQRSLTRRSILALALVIENEQGKILSMIQSKGETQQESNQKVANLRKRAMDFFRYVDSHMDHLVNINSSKKPRRFRKRIKSKGMKFLRSIIGDEIKSIQDEDNGQVQVMEENEQLLLEKEEIQDFKSKLAIISWVPVCVKPPDANLPWSVNIEDASQCAIVVASPQNTRPAKFGWLCSAQFRILEGVAYSDELRSCCGWEDTLPASIVASQLKSMVEKYLERPPESHGSNTNTQTLWTAVFEIYKLLSRFFEMETDMNKVEEVLSCLGGNIPLVWVGKKFVSAHQVASISQINAEPYLYTIPSELIHFRPFLKAIGVRDKFSVGDYLQVLEVLYRTHRDPLQTEEDEGIENRSIPLSEDALMKSISIIQLASDMMTHHSDWEIFAPDVNGRVLHASKLTYDDAPWIDKHSSELSSEMKSLRFLHPKLSNEVAGKIGAKSLRAKLLLANSGNETISFGVESSEMEAFGQTEALTRRISHILEQYPDGPNVFNELIQNADDAGATKVSILYHGGTFGTSSLLSPSMAKWQGPALYCFNDAEFKENDFISLARIGQGNKLQRANTTGRFGLGFNAVYHYTDLPTIVSANSIVMFDPHACFLPGITPSNPGIKIRFLNSTIVNQFPDQFKPLEMFGCDLKNHFHGTLFRFPLRNESTAGTSEIKRIAYSEKDIGLLLKSFKTIITSTILFLRNVRQVEVYVQLNDCTSPILLFGAEVPSEDRGESWQSIEKFMKGDNPNTSESKNNKRAFYAKLRSTPQEKLPSVIQTLHIRGYEHQSCDHIIRGLKADSLVSSLPNESADSSLKEFVEKYLVCSQIGGGKAREIACAPENESLKLIPWVGIAARFDTNSTLLQQETEGRAFCFLPLPVRTGLPVHINGYFELSSNRRDIWHGEDMTGEGKLRSEWNRYLLSDAVAPAYLNFLLEAKRILLERSLGDDYGKAKYFSLFPSSLPSSPWNHVVSSLFSSMRSRSMFWDISTPANHEESKEASEQSYVSFSPEKTVLIDDKVSTWKTLKQAIETTEFHTINVHTPLRNLFVDLNATHAIMIPHFFRELMRTKRNNFLSSIDESLLKHVIAYSFEDCKDLATLTNEMDGLNIVPTMDGSFATLRVLSASTSSGDNIGAEYFFCKNSIEEELLLMLDGSSCRSRIIKSEFKSIFESLPGEFFALFNVKIMNYLTMCSFLKLILPHKWQLKTQEEGSVNGLVQWLPGDDPSHPSKEWVETWWRYSEMELSQKSINPGHLPIDALAGWPLIPTLRNDVLHLARLRSEIPLFVHEPDTKTSLDILQEMLGLLNKLGMQVIDCSFVCGEETVSWLLKSGLANALNSNGVLKSLELLALDTEQSLRRENPKKQFQYPLDALFDEVSESEKQALLNFLVANERSAIDDIFIEVLKELPIFPVYNLDKSQYKRYVCLNRGGGIIPSTDADERALDEHFFLIKNDNTRKFLCDMGIPEWNFTTILLEYVFPNLVKYEEVSSELVDGIVMDALIALPFHQRNDARFKDFVRSNAICPSQRRQMRRISDLHDPNIKELVALVGINALPAETLMKQDMIIDILRSLGLRTSLSAHGILESARAVETLLCENPEDARTKSYSLVSIVNKCFDQLLEEMSNQTDAIEIIETLKKIKWLPVHSKPLKPLMPWKKQDPNPHILIASAIDTRPQKDAVSFFSDLYKQVKLSDCDK
jgi:sacsin